MEPKSEQQQTIIDGLSVLRLGLINLIGDIRALDPSAAANEGAQEALENVLEPSLRSIIAGGLDWVGDVSLAMNLNLTSGGLTDTPVVQNASPAMKRSLINTCFAARAELRRVSTLLDKDSSGINTALVRIKGATETTRAAFRSVLSRIESIDAESARNSAVRVTKEMSTRAVRNARQRPPRVATGSQAYQRQELPPLAASPLMQPRPIEPSSAPMMAAGSSHPLALPGGPSRAAMMAVGSSPPPAGPIAQQGPQPMVAAPERGAVSHEYSMSQRARVERVVSRDELKPMAQSVLFAEVGPGRGPWKRPRPAATFRSKRRPSRFARGTQPKPRG